MGEIIVEMKTDEDREVMYKKLLDLRNQLLNLQFELVANCGVSDCPTDPESLPEVSLTEFAEGQRQGA